MNKEIQELLSIIETLLAPEGCPWDREQTLKSMRSNLLEEAYEVIEAIDLDSNQKIEEELGDLFFNVLFMCRLGEKEKRFTMASCLKHIIAKLIHRHPHIFGDAKVENSEQVLKQWDEIKKRERKEKSILDSIPKNLPSLIKAQKISKKLSKTDFVLPQKNKNTFHDEESFGGFLFETIQKGLTKGLDPDQSLLKFLSSLEKSFKEWESNQ